MAEFNAPLPLSYRAELLKQIMPDLRAGECCSLIGPSGTGKSNLARFLKRVDVQYEYWKDDHTWIFVLDSNNLSVDEQTAEYYVLETMIHQLLEEAEKRNFSSDFSKWAENLYQRVIDNPTSHTALRILRDICRRLCEKHNLQLVFVFDQFDELWQKLDAYLFLNLRGLRDEFKYQVVYLTITRDLLYNMRKEQATVESFWEIFSAHTYGLGCYSENDATIMLERLALRKAVTVSEERKCEVRKLSGQHPGMIRAIFWAWNHASTEEFSPGGLLRITPICEECQKIWKSLSSSEQHLCQIVARDLPLHSPGVDALSYLRFKGIVFGNPPTFFSPVFAAYILQKTETGLLGVVVDTRLRQVWLDGQLLKQSLPALEFKLLAYLARFI